VRLYRDDSLRTLIADVTGAPRRTFAEAARAALRAMHPFQRRAIRMGQARIGNLIETGRRGQYSPHTALCTPEVDLGTEAISSSSRARFTSHTVLQHRAGNG
jgi:hypothetical protein